MNLDFFFFFFDFLKKMGRSDDGKRNILLGWPNLCVLWRCKSRENVLVYDLFIFKRQCIYSSLKRCKKGVSRNYEKWFEINEQ